MQAKETMLTVISVGIIGIIFRLALYYDAFNDGLMTHYTQSDALQSLLFHPHYLLENIRENIFRSHHTNNANPLITVLMERLLNTAPNLNHAAALTLLAIIMDVMIAIQLYKLAKAYTEMKYDHSFYESELENIMNPRIHPINAERQVLFGMRFEDNNPQTRGIFCNANLPFICSMAYFLNPLTIITSACGIASIQGIVALLIVMSLHSAIIGNANQSGLCLALLVQLDVYHFIFLIPLAIIWMQGYEFQSQKLKGKRPSWHFYAVCFSFWYMVSTISAIILFGWSFSSFLQSFNLTKIFEDVYPNIGMDWYFLINTFARYKDYFIVLCSGFLFLFCIPLLVRFYKYPLEMMIMFLLLKAIFHPLPTVVDVSLVVGIISIARRTVARMKIYSLIFFVAIPVPIGLYIVDYDLWLKSGSGNANYMFFQCLAYNLFVGVILLDFMASTLNRDKALVLTEKQNREVSLESTSTDAGANNDSNGSNIDDAKKKD